MKNNFNWIAETDIAHRGLFKAGTRFEENTLASLSKAVDEGYAIELDVRLTLDNQVVVYHDARLERLTNGIGYVSEYIYDRLKTFEVGATGLPMPLLTEVLDMVAERVPIYIEVKCPSNMDPSQICAGVRFATEGYFGPIAIMSFHPDVPKWVKNYAPHFARGLVLDYHGLTKWHQRIRTNLSIKGCDPQFLAMDIGSLPNDIAVKWRKSEKALLTWTVKSPAQEKIGRDQADALIFEQPAVLTD